MASKLSVLALVAVGVTFSLWTIAMLTPGWLIMKVNNETFEKWMSASEIYLSGNQLNGLIPSQMGTLLSLEHLDLEFNEFTGLIPSQLGKILSLRYLHLWQSLLMGSIPSQLGTMLSLLALPGVPQAI